MNKKRDLEGKRLHHFELSDKNRTVRWVFIVILLAIAVVSITAGLLSVLQTPAGWQKVTVNSANFNCSSEFVLQYEYGAGESTPTAESKALEILYGQVVEDAWKLFFNEAGQSNLLGMYEINQHPNEQIVVDSKLYQALEQVVDSGSRVLYLAPVYAEYDRVFYSTDESIARDCDPGQNEDQRAYVQTLADFAGDAQTVALVLGDNNQVMLRVSQEYLAFAKKNEIRYLLDFGWMRNAFVADYIASVLTENGFTNGYIASVDGFTRNLDPRGNGYSLNLFNRRENGIDLAATMNYTAPQSLVFLRNYPMNDLAYHRYYGFSDGRIVTAMIDPADGQSKSAIDNLLVYSDQYGCGQLALAIMPVYVADAFSESELNMLTEQEIYSVWFQGTKLMYNQKDLEVTIKDAHYTK